MSKSLYMDPSAEQEANNIGQKFMHSHDVVGDMSRSYGVDLSHVQIHTDDHAAQMTQDRGVDAFSTGKDVFFGRDTFKPHDPASRGLLAHELGHSLQQGVGGSPEGMANSVPMGSAQGGIIDFFRNLFHMNPQQEQQEEAPKQEWVEDEYGKINPEYVTTHPKEGELATPAMLKDTQRDGLAQAPIFETHTIAPRESDDGISAIRLHSFAGLRFTQRVGSELHRRRIVFGFGGNGLRNDWDYQADASTETPITRRNLDILLDTEIYEKASKPYDLLNYNCNHFVTDLAKKVGANVPAKLHKSTFGPLGAHTAIAGAATKGEQDRTRFFQGGAHSEEGQLGMDNRTKLMDGFFDTAKKAAFRDHTPFLLYPSLRQNAAALQEAASRMEKFYPSRDPSFFPEIVDTGAKKNELQNTLAEVEARGKALIETRTLVSHPRVNMVTMKTMALAQKLENTFFPEYSLLKHQLPSYVYETSLDTLLEPEKKDAPSAISNQTYFSKLHTNSDYDPEYYPAMQNVGELFLEAANLNPVHLLQDSLSAGDDRDVRDQYGLNTVMGNQARVAHAFDLVYQGLANGNEELIDRYLQRYASSHTSLNHSQMATTITAGILIQLSNVATKFNSSLNRELSLIKPEFFGIAKRREENSLDNEKTNPNLINGFDNIETFLGRQRKKRDGFTDFEKRKEAISSLNAMERFLKDRLDRIMAPQEGNA